MAYTPYGWQNPYYAQPMPDNLDMMRETDDDRIKDALRRAMDMMEE